MKKLWETGIILFSVLGFWGMIYPDLCFTEDVCEVIMGDVSESVLGGIPKDGEMDIFTGLCDAKPEQIRMKSRIFEKLKSESKGKGNGVSDE